MSIQLLHGARLFDGHRFHEQSGLLIENGKIIRLVEAGNDQGQSWPENTQIIDLQGGILAPGFIDAQVNGGGGVMLNDGPSAELMFTIAAGHRPYGTTSLLPTLITDTGAVTANAMAVAADAVAADKGVAGLHLEGPHLAPTKKGAHLAELMRPVAADDIKAMIATAEKIGTQKTGTEKTGCLVVTIAAEQITPDQVRELAEGGVIVSIGHSDCSYEEAMQRFDAGARGVTHLFNAMSQFGHRAPNLVGAALDHPAVWGGIIADGHHVEPAALRVALRAKRGEGRLFFVTDAMSLVGSGRDTFQLNGRTIQRIEGGYCPKLVLEDGKTLAGSDLDMASAIRYGMAKLDLSTEEALRMATSYPAAFLKLTDRGVLAPNKRADLVWLDDQCHVKATWIAGQGQNFDQNQDQAL
ncbi:N-acetylglucosamine-6-phosphate deacetylase [Pseudochrobactrum sp. MP213Fo]|uniref:N-acetylglucosamine-6-phosphate deacetylase n=1 Tax=Pseudochrobactrum sp. MP213Fo TaxID=3022250 RepID=UPI003B9F98C7